MKHFIQCLLMIGLTTVLGAQEITHDFSTGSNAAYYLDDNKGYDLIGGFTPISYDPVEAPSGFGNGTDQGRDLGNGWGGVELEVFFRHKMKIPFLAGKGGMTKGNNLTLSSRVFLTPVSVHLQEELVWTPIAFLTVEAGALLGTGWTLDFMGISGFGRNSDGTGNISTTDTGIVFNTHGAATFQFDVEALWPGDWHHIVFVANGKFMYQYCSAADQNDAWIWRSDDGENFNGWEFHSTFFLGYQMPIFLDTVGFLLTTEQKLGSIRTSSMMADGGWGSDFVELRFGPVLNFNLGKGHELTLLVQFKTAREYIDATVFFNWFQNRSSTGEAYVDLYRIALAYTWSI